MLRWTQSSTHKPVDKDKGQSFTQCKCRYVVLGNLGVLCLILSLPLYSLHMLQRALCIAWRQAGGCKVKSAVLRAVLSQLNIKLVLTFPFILQCCLLVPDRIAVVMTNLWQSRTCHNTVKTPRVTSAPAVNCCVLNENAS